MPLYEILRTHMNMSNNLLDIYGNYDSYKLAYNVFREDLLFSNKDIKVMIHTELKM